jgi:hypothetical protein
MHGGAGSRRAVIDHIDNPGAARGRHLPHLALNATGQIAGTSNSGLQQSSPSP